MKQLFPATLAILLATLPQQGFSLDASLLQGCYYAQTKEPGQWVTKTSALYIEKTDDGILLHGSESKLHSSWISTPDGESPVALQKVGNRYVYEGERSPQKPHTRCELVLTIDKESIHIKKFDRGCAKNWNTGEGLGPSMIKLSDKQPDSHWCLSYLGIIDKTAPSEE